MKAKKLIVFVFIAILLATSIMTATHATTPDKSAIGDVTPAAKTTGWLPDQQVAHTAWMEVHPSIATAGDGSLWVAYEYYNPGTNLWEIQVAKSTDGGVTWTLMLTHSITGYNLHVPSIAVDVYTNWVYVAYQRDYSTTNHDIHLLYFNGTDWHLIYVDNTSSDDYSPSIAIENDMGDHPGGGNFVFITWERHVSSTDYELVFDRSTNHGQGSGWDPEILLTNHGAGEYTEQPSMTFASGTAGHCIYIAYRDATAGGQYKIGLLRSTDEGTSFGAPQDITSFGSHSVSDPSIAATHGGGTVVAAWVYAYSSTDDNIYYGYSTDSGVTWNSSWPMAISTSNEVYPHLTVDGMGSTASYLGNIHATYEVIEHVGSRYNGMYYRTANYATPTSWSTAVQVADDNADVSSADPNVADRAITTVHNTVPVIVWPDERYGVDIYATTLGGKYTIDTSPSPLAVAVDGALHNAPQSFYWAYQSIHTLSVPSPQGQYGFLSWSDGGAQSHSITANTLGETTITAKFVTCLVVRGTDNHIYYRTYSGSTWGSWNSLPTGTTIDTPAAACADKLYIVVRGSDGSSLWFSSLNLITSSFSGWTQLSGSTPSTPTLSSNGTALALVVRGGDNRIYYCIYTIASATWTGWSALPSGTTLDAPAASLVGNTLSVIVRGSDGTSLWYSYINPTTSAFSGWGLLSGSTPSPPTLTRNGNLLAIVVRGGDNRIYYTSNGISWNSLPTGTTMDTPAATIIQNTLYTVVRGSDGASLWTSNVNLGTSSFSGWTLLSGSTPSKPTLTS